MRYPRSFPTLLLLLLWTLPGSTPVTAQTVSVRLEAMGESGGPVAEGFRTALRELEETELVGPAEAAEYVINVSALCVPEADSCESAEAFGVSVVLSEPLSGGALRSGLSRTGDRTLSEWRAGPEAEALFQRYRQMHAVWTTRWGTDRVREGIERLVGGIDVRCFEKRRTLKREARLRARGDSVRAEAYIHDLEVDGSWLC